MLSALRDSIVFFNSPTDVAAKHLRAGHAHAYRRPGQARQPAAWGQPAHSFCCDGRQERIAVRYQGIVPDLFREGQGVVAEGKLDAGGVFVADTVLAKHDERYMPREVVDALKKSGHWQEGEEKKSGSAAR